MVERNNVVSIKSFPFNIQNYREEMAMDVDQNI